MSAIGDYVHLTYKGYVLERGMHREPFFNSASTAIAAKQRIFENDVNKMHHHDMDKLEEQLNKDLDLLNEFQMANKGSSQYVAAEKDVAELVEDISDELLEKYVRIDLIAAAANGLLDAAGRSSGTALTKRKKNGKANTSYQNNVIQAVNTQIEDLLVNETNNIAKLTRQNGVSEQEVEKVAKKTKEEIKKYIRTWYNRGLAVNLGNKRTQNKIKSLYSNLQNLVDSNNIGHAQIGKEIKRLESVLFAGMGTASNYKGDVGEAIVAAAANRLAATSLKSIQEAMVTGRESSSRGVDTYQFTPLVDWKQISSAADEKFQSGDFLFSTSGKSPDKVDVKIELKNNEHIYASVKNYSTESMKKGFKNSSANFLSLIQNENDHNFINHWLNLSAVHTDSGSNKWSINSGDRINAYDLVKKITVAKLITGYQTQVGSGSKTMNAANIFVIFNSRGKTLVNNTAGASVKLYSMKDVLDGVFASDRYKKIAIPSGLYDTNAWQPEISQRLTNLMKALSFQVSYTLKMEEFDKGK